MMSEVGRSRTIVFLHDKFTNRRRDKYVLCMVQAFGKMGYQIYIYTSHFDLSDFHFDDHIHIKWTGTYMPNSLFGYFRWFFSFIKATYTVFKVFMCPPTATPDVVIVDVWLWTVYILKLFNKYVVCLEHLPNTGILDDRLEYSKNVSNTKLQMMNLADQIIVESDGIAALVKYHYPHLKKNIIILYRPIDVGLWNKPTINIHRIVPDLPSNMIIFLTIGKFAPASNLTLTCEAFGLLIDLINDKDLTDRFHLVIASNCKTSTENIYCAELIADTVWRSWFRQVTFLRQMPTIHEKTLICNALVAIHPAQNDLLSDFVLKAMCLGKPIVATDKGMASKIITHKFSGVCLKPDAMEFAKALKELVLNHELRDFYRKNARDRFHCCYSFSMMCRKLNSIATKLRDQIHENTRN
ncbi:uncharacterized protein LOC109607356 [Aethina tumida]|uniref:uncharacterized protein LOC109607356 n=1 Tax=Aethina tumida TaxID=116153 RepID=UPI002148B394|nr:uncharacterized protein LOC109607356 [Aethina tumida]